MPLLSQLDLSFLQNDQSIVLWQVSGNSGVRGVGEGNNLEKLE